MLHILDIIGVSTSSEEITELLHTVLYLLIIIGFALIAGLLTRKVLLKIVERIVTKNKAKWDDIFLRNKVFDLSAHIVPALVVYLAAPLVGVHLDLIRRLVLSYILVVSTFVISSVLNSINDIYTTYPISKTRPIKSLLQIIKIALFIIMGIVVLANLMGESPLILLSGIGAATALFSLIFKDPILGFVAGIQLTGNDMLKIGDWISVPKYGADGSVIDLTMTTVKVQNFDKTIVHIPAYALISDSFKNWRGMSESGGRRIKRSIRIDISSIKFCTPEMIEKYKKIQLISDYIIRKLDVIEKYNTEHGVDKSIIINGRMLTNIGTFRAYINSYLKNNPNIHQSMISMVRQLAPDEKGVSLEIYAFTNTTNWIEYENIQSDIFDHILAAVQIFDLRVYQQPSGYDFKSAGDDRKVDTF
ncbi:MAG: mechanosensitive ion channel family protein [Eubacteriales bacterium]|jgi:miniconductance mechanosensitive channel